MCLFTFFAVLLLLVRIIITIIAISITFWVHSTCLVVHWNPAIVIGAECYQKRLDSPNTTTDTWVLMMLIEHQLGELQTARLMYGLSTRVVFEEWQMVITWYSRLLTKCAHCAHVKLCGNQVLVNSRLVSNIHIFRLRRSFKLHMHNFKREYFVIHDSRRFAHSPGMLSTKYQTKLIGIGQCLDRQQFGITCCCTQYFRNRCALTAVYQTANRRAHTQNVFMNGYFVYAVRCYTKVHGRTKEISFNINRFQVNSYK